jgi:WhiB family redox-sensing transcriptional regulator
MDQAACAGHDDPDLWFPERGEGDCEQEALRICGGCQVRSACLAYALPRPA